MPSIGYFPAAIMGYSAVIARESGDPVVASVEIDNEPCDDWMPRMRGA